MATDETLISQTNILRILALGNHFSELFFYFDGDVIPFFVYFNFNFFPLILGYFLFFFLSLLLSKI